MKDLNIVLKADVQGSVEGSRLLGASFQREVRGKSFTALADQ